MSNTPKFAPYDSYMALVLKHGLKTEEKASWMKVYPHGPKGPRLYVAIQEKGVRCVELTFQHRLGTLTQMPHNGVHGSIVAQLRLTGTAEGDLAQFEEALLHLASLPAPEPKQRKAKKDSSPAAPQVGSPGEESEVPAEDEAAKRLAHIAKVEQLAQSRGVPLSPKLIAEREALLLKVGIPEQPVAQASSEE